MDFIITVSVDRVDGGIGTTRADVEEALLEAVENASLDFTTPNGGNATFEITTCDISEPPRVRKPRKAKVPPPLPIKCEHTNLPYVLGRIQEGQVMAWPAYR